MWPRAPAELPPTHGAVSSGGSRSFQLAAALQTSSAACSYKLTFLKNREGTTLIGCRVFSPGSFCCLNNS